LMLESMRISSARDPEILFVIAGSDETYSQRINAFFRQHSMTENLICYGQVEYGNIPGILALSDVCLSFLEDTPVYQLSPPQKVIEYFAAGKTVIANIITTHNDMITDSFNGFLTSCNPQEVAEKIIYLKTNPEVHQQMCINALKTAESYDMIRVYQQMKEVIQGILDKS
jgi:glycosyltransferase involved in cell wall biosynthesis